MSEINLQLVREFFELNRFSVLTHWRHGDDRARSGEDASLLFVEHLHGEEAGRAPFLLSGATIQTLRRAVVEVRAWHGDRFYPSVVESSPILAHVASREVNDLAQEVFGGAGFATLLVISELPTSTTPRARSLQMLQALGIGHVLEFGVLLAGLASQLNSHGNYAPSHTLQTLRLLKRYDLLRRQQLELPFPQEPLQVVPAPGVESDLLRQHEVLDDPDRD